jgi:hypothetical protein
MASGTSIMVQALLAGGATSAIVDDRIEPFPLRASTRRPGIAVSLVDETDGYKLDGAIKYPQSRVSVHCIAESATAADALAEAVKQDLIDYRGELLDAEVTIFKAGSDYSDYADDLSTFRRVVDFVVRWRNLEGT